ncbi:serine hydrolase [Stutzerimonas xanthomarina]|uniref:serine hydrolase n=1 Tax=Stutzerimonas xanthomarina TaxID=271420 RepID=UPI003AA82DFD
MYPTPKIQTRLVAAAVLATLSCDVVASGGIEKLDRTVDASAKAVMAEHGIHGMAVAITAQGQQRFFDFGVASKKTGQPVTRNTLFEVGSISKTFAVTLAAYAQAQGTRHKAQGKLSLNDSPSRYYLTTFKPS